MKFYIYKASDGFREYEKPCEKAIPANPMDDGFYRWVQWRIEINSLEDLINLMKETNSEIILSENRIIIYDDYVE